MRRTAPWRGAIEAARDLGLSAEETAAAAASGALRTAGELGSEAVEQVQKVVHGTIDGVKVVPRIARDR